MKNHREFEIAHVGLKPGEHQYSYQLTESFFEEFGQTEFRNADFKLNLELDKKSNFFHLKFDVTGTCVAMCDRCGDDFTLQIWDDFDSIIKIVDAERVEQMNIDDCEVLHVAHSANHLDISSIIYENIVLCLPIQRVHPDNEHGQSTCNPKALELLGQHKVQVEEIKAKEEQNNSLREQIEQLKKKKDAKS
jgi:uncharacterized metal-binding protein YceD (DUF177 family)